MPDHIPREQSTKSLDIRLDGIAHKGETLQRGVAMVGMTTLLMPSSIPRRRR
jgi:hypothetical protein